MARIVATSEADVVDAVRAARDRKSTLEIVGAGTKRGLGRPVACDDVLDLAGLAGIVRYEPDELVITVKTGTTIAEIEAAITPKAQRLGFGPTDWGKLYAATPANPTIGGMLAADASGSLALRYGRVRNHLLGTRGVNGFGEAYKAGGHVVKNVTGFDLPKLMCGAFGTLGVMTEATLRLYPRPEHSWVVAIKDVTPERGLALLRAALAAPMEPASLSFIPAKMSPYLSAHEAFAEVKAIGAGAALVSLEGTAPALAEKRAMLRTLAGGFHLADVANGEAVQQRLSCGMAFADSPLDLWRIVIPPSSALALLEALNPMTWYADWAGGCIWIGQTPGSRPGFFHEHAQKLGGHATLMRASDALRAKADVFTPLSPVEHALSRSVKAAFDPLRLFNPGRMFEDV